MCPLLLRSFEMWYAYIRDNKTRRTVHSNTLVLVGRLGGTATQWECHLVL